ARIQSVERRPCGARHRAKARAGVEAAEQRVHAEPELQLPRTPPGLAVNRNEEWLELDQLRGDPEMDGALAQALAHQRELTRLQVAQSSVNQLARAARGTAGERGLLDQERVVARGGGGLQHTCSVNPSADDRDIVLLH